MKKNIFCCVVISSVISSLYASNLDTKYNERIEKIKIERDKVSYKKDLEKEALRLIGNLTIQIKRRDTINQQREEKSSKREEKIITR